MAGRDLEELAASLGGMNIREEEQTGRWTVADEGEPINTVEPDHVFTDDTAVQPKALSERIDVVEEGGHSKEEEEVLCVNETTKDGKSIIATNPTVSKSRVRTRIVRRQKSAQELGLDEKTKDDNSDVTTNPAPSTDHLHRRVDSHQENTKDSSLVKSELVQLQEELRQTKNELQEASARSDELSKEFERYKTQFNLTKQFKALSKATVIGKELEACRKELGELKAKNESRERRDSNEQRRLDGRCLSDPLEKISFYKHKNKDQRTEVSLIRSWNFPRREWLESGVLRKEADKAAIGYIRFEGHTYIARSGKNQEGMGFIDRDYWANEALLLATLVNTSFPFGKNYEKHVEPQLMAFYITRTLQASNRALKDFVNLSRYQKGQPTGISLPIYIYVSEGYICESCEGFIEGVNAVMERYGYYFDVVFQSA